MTSTTTVNKLVDHNIEFGAFAATFAFSMLGFLSAVMGLFAVVAQSRAYRGYRGQGYLGILMGLLGVAMAELALAFVAAMQLFFGDPTSSEVMCVVVSLAAAGGMTLVAVGPTVALQIRAAFETHEA